MSAQAIENSDSYTPEHLKSSADISSTRESSAKNPEQEVDQ